ncbi:MAG: hypothetical protein ABI426_12025 [Flavobacterium sp.]
MKTKKFALLIVLTILIATSSFSLKQSAFNPTGTYELNEHTKERNDGVYGYFGTIQVKKINHTKIAMTFYICKGAPSYNSGSFVDTLDFSNNVAIHKDEDCVTIFTFTKKGIDVKEQSHRSCWGGGVVAHGHFKKTSGKEPVLTDPETGEKL